MRFAVACCIYDDQRFIKPFVKQFPEWIDQILFLVSERPWFGLYSESAFKTVEEIKSCGDSRVTMVRLPWQNEHEQRSWGLGHLWDFDWVFTMDTDEFFTPEGWEELYKVCHELHSGTNALVAGMKTYWKDFDHVWEPADLHKPTIAVRPKKVLFHDKREIGIHEMRWEIREPMHHLSWARTDEEVWKKINNYMHAKDFDLVSWYDSVWKPWTIEKTGLRPYGSTSPDTRAVPYSLPDSIRKLWG